MIELNLEEAQLFRLLTSFFGRDWVIPRMSVATVCEGVKFEDPTMASWAATARCLFTVVDQRDQPKLVVEFCSDLKNTVDIEEEEHKRVLGPLLERRGIHYLTVTIEELRLMSDPFSGVDLEGLLRDRFLSEP